jgi:hypothetical protein
VENLENVRDTVTAVYNPARGLDKTCHGCLSRKPDETVTTVTTEIAGYCRRGCHDARKDDHRVPVAFGAHLGRLGGEHTVYCMLTDPKAAARSGGG